MPSKVKLKLKGGVAVDPDSGLEDVAHVYQDGKEKFTVTLGVTDIQTKKNSYYKLQLLEADKGYQYWVFRSWGRIGTSIGGWQISHFFVDIVCFIKFYLLFKLKNYQLNW